MLQETVRLVRSPAKSKKKHIIDQDKCIKCGKCLENLQVRRDRKESKGGGTIMNKFRLNINGKEVTGLPGQTILRSCQRK